MTSSSNKIEAEASAKYFLAQAIGSGLFLLSAISLQHYADSIIPLYMSSALLLLRLSIKLGIAPLHYWFPEVISKSSWHSCILLVSWQKIIPLFIILHSVKINLFSISIIASTRAIVGALGGVIQTSLPPLIAYSSINHLGWILRSIMFSRPLACLYFFIYALTSILIISHFIINNSFYIKQSPNHKKAVNFLSLTPIFLLLSLGGLPPLLGFAPKLIIIFLLIQNSFFVLCLLLLLGSIISLSFYLNLCFNLYSCPPTIRLNIHTKSKTHYIIIPSLLSLGILPAFLYAMILFYKPQRYRHSLFYFRNMRRLTRYLNKTPNPSRIRTARLLYRKRSTI